MCKLPDIESYVRLTPEEKDIVSYKFMEDIKTNMGWYWKALVLLFGLFSTASSVGYSMVESLRGENNGRDEKLVVAVEEIAKARASEDRRYSLDSLATIAIMERLLAIERKIETE